MATDLLRRHALGVALELLSGARGVVISGPRQAGKSELLRMIAREVGGDYLSLDQPHLLRTARTDPTGFVAGHDKPLLVDEVQRGGDPLLLALKVLLDASRAPGQAVLAGSTRFLSEPRLSESLAGRVRLLDLWPFTQGEIDGLDDGHDRLVDLLFRPTDELRDRLAAVHGESRRATMARVARGGFPEAVAAATARGRRGFFADYLRTVGERDIRELGALGQRVELPRILRLLAARTANELNISDLANDAGLGNETTRRYLPLVETILLSVRLSAWSGSFTARQKRRPKIHVADSGLAAFLLEADEDRLARPIEPVAGQLLETFVATEVLKQQTWADELTTLYHWRDDGGREIDLVLETTGGRVAAIEVKAAVDVLDADVRALAYVRDRLGDRFVNGVVLHCGERMQRWGDRITSMPINALWEA